MCESLLCQKVLAVPSLARLHECIAATWAWQLLGGEEENNNTFPSQMLFLIDNILINFILSINLKTTKQISVTRSEADDKK